MKRLALLGLLVLGTAKAMACYTVYDASNRVVYNAPTPPVDMRLPLHQTLPRVFPGGHMVFAVDSNCAAVVSAPSAVSAPGMALRAKNSAPLLTDRATAVALRLPHATLSSGAAVVPSQIASQLELPTFSVIDSGAAVASAAAVPNPTATMGAGPSSYRPAPMPLYRSSDAPRRVAPAR